jgi:hypothetical protein
LTNCTAKEHVDIYREAEFSRETTECCYCSDRRSDRNTLRPSRFHERYLRQHTICSRVLLLLFPNTVTLPRYRPRWLAVCQLFQMHLPSSVLVARVSLEDNLYTPGRNSLPLRGRLCGIVQQQASGVNRRVQCVCTQIDHHQVIACDLNKSYCKKHRNF